MKSVVGFVVVVAVCCCFSSRFLYRLDGEVEGGIRYGGGGV